MRHFIRAQRFILLGIKAIREKAPARAPLGRLHAAWFILPLNIIEAERVGAPAQRANAVLAPVGREKIIIIVIPGARPHPQAII
jgi:hypothetical protein